MAAICAAFFALLVTAALVLVPAIMASGARNSASDSDSEAVRDGPQREELAFRLTPTLGHAFVLLAIAVGVFVTMLSRGVVDPTLLRWLTTTMALCTLGTIPMMLRIDHLLRKQLIRRDTGQAVWRPIVLGMDRTGLVAEALLWGMVSTMAGPVMALACGPLIIVAIVFTPPNPFDSVATAAASSSLVLLLHIPVIWLLSARLFSNCHSIDTLSDLYISSESYHRHIFQKGLIWGLPYASVIAAGTALMLWIVISRHGSVVAFLLGLLIPLLGIPASFSLTTRLHLASNRLAKITHEQIDPIAQLVDRVTTLVGEDVSGEVECVVKWLELLARHDVVRLPLNDRLIAQLLLDRLVGRSDTAARRYQRIYHLARTLVDAYDVYRPKRLSGGRHHDEDVLASIKRSNVHQERCKLVKELYF